MIVSVYDNYLSDPEFKADWGFSTIVITHEDVILFDTGEDPDILLFNMDKAGIKPESITKVLISHIHRDHLGGLEGFLELNNEVTVYIPWSFPRSVIELIIEKGANFKEVSGPLMISDHVYSSGVFSGDPDEQALVIETGKGLIVITGCAHPGIVRMVESVRSLFEREEVHLVAGGFHRPSIECVERFRELGVVKVAPSHCSGDQIREALRDEYGEDFIDYGAGKKILIRTD